ncbi:hypothetical protein BLNAU_7416 [Blattamonas nauphoetae]|uniref:Uncharacterized protein n=1 Tax=Blattamonas nauphoetae TaxID=2049346 RepID=A0ABQ9Y199_9EUKA|nr:hypothetical protein BLNAU_7416 [Blattamonas nauphoetae]
MRSACRLSDLRLDRSADLHLPHPHPPTPVCLSLTTHTLPLPLPHHPTLPLASASPLTTLGVVRAASQSLLRSMHARIYFSSSYYHSPHILPRSP